MALAENVILDTSALYALASDRDAFHQRATYTYHRLIDQGQRLWTTAYALVETIALIQRRLGFTAMSNFINGMADEVSILWVQNDFHYQAWDRLMEHQGAGLSFVDWTIALASRRLDAVIFTFDSGFVSRGYSVIPRLRV